MMLTRFQSLTRLVAFLALFIPATLSAQMGQAAVVRVAEAAVKPIASITLVPGTVISRNDARLSAEVPGRLIMVSDVGTEFKEGEIVAEIEDTTLLLRKVELEADILRVEAQLRFLESEEKRFTQLAESNLAAKTQLEQTRSDRDVARADLAVARARLKQNADQIERTSIEAPYDGVVVERLMTPGERVVEGSAVVRLVDPDHLEVIARAPLDYYEYVQRGQMLEVRAGQLITEARVRTVVAVGDEQTHQFELRLDFDGAPFPVGRTLRVAIPTSDLRDVLTIPRDAIVLRPEGQSVFVIDGDNLAQQVMVTVGIGQGSDIEVFGGLTAGDRVVIRGNERLQPGQPVQIMDS